MTNSTLEINCPVCNAELKSIRGLSMHLSRMHKSEVSDEQRKVYLDAARAVKPEKVCEVVDVVDVVDEVRVATTPVPVSALSAPVELEEGDRVHLKGTHFKLSNGAYEQVQVDLEAVVQSKVLSGDVTWIMLEDDRRVTYSVDLAGVDNLKLVTSTAWVVQKCGSSDKFEEAVIAFGDANEIKKTSEKKFKKVKAEHHNQILEYVKSHGVSEDPKASNLTCYAAGYKALVSEVAVSESVQYDQEAMVAWAIQNGKTELLTQSIDLAAWKELKASGGVPDAIIRECEELKEGTTNYRLIVSVVSDN